MSKDWNGNKKSIYVTLGASNHVEEERQEDDFYATDPKALDILLCEGGVVLKSPVLEPACGNGILSDKLKEYGYDVISRDLIDRGYGETGIDFLTDNRKHNGTILTNPPYKYAQQFVEHALDIIEDGDDVYMFLKLQFLEGKARRQLFDTRQLKEVFVSSSRLICAKNADFDSVSSSAVAYAWFHWIKGYNGDPIIKWIN